MSVLEPRTGYELRDTSLIGWAWDSINNCQRHSVLELDMCVTFQAGWDGPEFRGRSSPSDIAQPLSQQYSNGDMSLTIEGDNSDILHLREESGLIAKTVTDKFINLNECIRRSHDGHIEWIHPSASDNIPAWLKVVADLGQATSKVPGGAVELAIDLATDKVKEEIMRQGNPDTLRFYVKTHYDDGKLIRRGT